VKVTQSRRHRERESESRERGEGVQRAPVQPIGSEREILFTIGITESGFVLKPYTPKQHRFMYKNYIYIYIIKAVSGYNR